MFTNTDAIFLNEQKHLNEPVASQFDQIHVLNQQNSHATFFRQIDMFDGLLVDQRPRSTYDSTKPAHRFQFDLLKMDSLDTASPSQFVSSASLEHRAFEWPHVLSPITECNFFPVTPYQTEYASSIYANGLYSSSLVPAGDGYNNRYPPSPVLSTRDAYNSENFISPSPPISTLDQTSAHKETLENIDLGAFLDMCDSVPASPNQYDGFQLQEKKRKQYTTGPYTKEKPKTYVCEFDGCGKTFLYPFGLKSHQSSHSDERPHECPKCPQKFQRKQDLNRHIRCKNHDKHHRCVACCTFYNSEQELEEHRKIPVSNKCLMTTWIVETRKG